MAEPQTPEGLNDHSQSYNPDAWKQYTIQELGSWVHLFVKRAGHRSDPDKRAKDLADAQNYLDMIQSHLDAAKSS